MTKLKCETPSNSEELASLLGGNIEEIITWTKISIQLDKRAYNNISKVARFTFF